VSALLETHGLVFGWDARAALGRAEGLALHGGEVLCLLGRNGSGKTTLLRTLLGLQPPLAGAVALEGHALAGLSDAARARALAYVPQAQVVPFPYTLEAMVTMGRTARLAPWQAPGAEDRAVARAALERVGLVALAGAAYTEVSAGERQLALIARALAQAAPAMLLDEPTAHLDFGNRHRVLQLLRALAADGIGVLFTTHDPADALRHADRVALLQGGQLACGVPAEVLTVARLSDAYGVPVRVERLADGTPVCVV